ncbi:hypothetical protein [Adhaeribacter radiodurans]|uniref:DUF4410 domain-containing protein n=1 Tax=Adhaeribacter radiodurans TaxID=2745197 RepID=A0A7L7L6U9_9BACT|nr:hypothetical protein [Adhaeribacter radiodurans]QMU27831.1 hypothetical protein HUW48_07130 [Adhaeribacter radiodurans]QMU28069.1 hypothetical protein HUW48_08420 [Adhaeribacter radiodurans]
MKTFCTFLCFFLATTLFCSAQVLLGEGSKQIFASPQLATAIKQHQTVAILPFEAKITYRKQPKNFSAEAHQEQEATLAQNIQSSMYTYLLRKAKSYSVTFQDVEKTNILLQKAGMYGKLKEFTRDEIAKALGVDAVISGKFDMEQTRSDGAALATAVVFGGYAGKTGSGSLTMTINNGQDGELLWRFFKTMDDDFTSSTDDMVERMMRKVSRNFPYAL